MDCHYCNKPTIKVTGKEIYPKIPSLHYRQFIQCVPCKAYVGCHAGSQKHKAFGIVAKPALRKLRTEVHRVFDCLWDEYHERVKAYAWLAKGMGLTKDECHIAKFNEAQCEEAYQACRNLIKQRRELYN